MAFLVEADFVQVMRGIVSSLQPFATENSIELCTEFSKEEVIVSYNPAIVIPDFAVLLSNIIALCPQGEQIRIGFQNSSNAICTIENSGVNLGSVSDIRSRLSRDVQVESTINGGTRYIYPIYSDSESKPFPTEDHSIIRPWYAEVRKNLKKYFSNVAAIEESAFKRSKEEGVFMRKVNAVLNVNLETGGFNAEQLARSMALSKAQLYRKVKRLSGMAPGQYIVHFRIEKAKEILTARELTVGEIAFRVGFLSVSHFSRTFSKTVGMTPTEYSQVMVEAEEVKQLVNKLK